MAAPLRGRKGGRAAYLGCVPWMLWVSAPGHDPRRCGGVQVERQAQALAEDQAGHLNWPAFSLASLSAVQLGVQNLAALVAAAQQPGGMQ
mgnify:CR=1 FL=1